MIYDSNSEEVLRKLNLSELKDELTKLELMYAFYVGQ